MPSIYSTLALNPGDLDAQWGVLTRLVPLVPYLILISLISSITVICLIARIFDMHAMADDTAISDRAMQAIRDTVLRKREEVINARIRALISDNNRLQEMSTAHKAAAKRTLQALNVSRSTARSSRKRAAVAVSNVAMLRATCKRTELKAHRVKCAILRTLRASSIPELVDGYTSREAEVNRLQSENDALRTELSASQALTADVEAQYVKQEQCLLRALRDRWTLRLKLAVATKHARGMEQDIDATKAKAIDMNKQIEDNRAIISKLSAQLQDTNTRYEDISALAADHACTANKLELELAVVKCELATTATRLESSDKTVLEQRKDRDEEVARLEAQVAEKDKAIADFEQQIKVSSTSQPTSSVRSQSTRLSGSPRPLASSRSSPSTRSSLPGRSSQAARPSPSSRPSRPLPSPRPPSASRTSRTSEPSRTSGPSSPSLSPAQSLSSPSPSSESPPLSPPSIPLPPSPPPSPHSIPLPPSPASLPELVDDDGSDSDPGSPPDTPYPDDSTLPDPEAKPPAAVTDADGDGLPIIPFPRKLKPLRKTTYSPRPMIRAGMLIRQALTNCKHAVPRLPSCEEDAMDYLESVGEQPPAPAERRYYRLRDEREDAEVECWIPRPTSDAVADDDRPLDYQGRSGRGVWRYWGSRIPFIRYE